MTIDFAKDVLFVCDLYAEDGDMDCLGFFPTFADAEAAGIDEVRRVADLADDERTQFDWAVRYSVRRCDPRA